MKNKILFHVIIIIIIAIPVAFLFYGWASLNYESQPDYKYTEVTRIVITADLAEHFTIQKSQWGVVKHPKKAIFRANGAVEHRVER